MEKAITNIEINKTIKAYIEEKKIGATLEKSNYTSFIKIIQDKKTNIFVG